MRVISLASGSSGNCYLVQSNGINVLIDCGLSPTNLKKYLAEQGVRVDEISAIFLTHEHSDHVRGAGIASRLWGVPVIANEKTLTAARYRWQKDQRLETQRAAQLNLPESKTQSHYNVETMPVGEVKRFGSLEVSSFPVSHDASDTVCYTFRADDQQGVILTDLGCATPEIFEPLNASQLIILEANHDAHKLRQSKYPASLKARISSNFGHLSNEQSAAILQRVLEESGLMRSVWLAHLSAENNSPKEALEFMNKWLERAGFVRFKLQVANRDRPSLRWDTQNAFFQSQMFF